MPTTLKHLINYPAGTAAPNVPLVMQTQAESVETALENLTTSWTVLTLGTGWTNYVGGGGYVPTLRCRKEGKTVRVFGMVRSGAAGSTITTLPADHRPLGSVIHPCEINAPGTWASVLIDSVTGAITYRSGAAAPTFLNINITFPLP